MTYLCEIYIVGGLLCLPWLVVMSPSVVLVVMTTPPPPLLKAPDPGSPPLLLCGERGGIPGERSGEPCEEELSTVLEPRLLLSSVPRAPAAAAGRTRAAILSQTPSGAGD
ncbi:unnamed protein product [Pleuronectes platessa]|uniref:Uncharacterized protein n=1 Tax=Pleuronectes platessa TaxID=8262 RepID=A0A9N7VIX3_PLEPL|nr:unnamed protein product [Pleuronectes platessa]